MSNLIPTWINDGKHSLDLARFVLEDDDFVNLLMSRAANELDRATGNRHRTFASAVATGDPEALCAVVEAVYLHLKESYHLRYDNERAFDEVTGAQRVRLPLTLRQENRATCLDLAL